jgi:hypothetical protein
MVVALGLVLAMGMVACGSDDTSNTTLTGTWSFQTYEGTDITAYGWTMAINADGTYSIITDCSEQGTYSTVGSTINLHVITTDCAGAVDEAVSYSISGNTLTLVNSDAETFTLLKQ